MVKFRYILFLKKIIYLAVPACSCDMLDIQPLLWHVGSSSPGIELGPPALGAQSLSHWTTREVLGYILELR